MLIGEVLRITWQISGIIDWHEDPMHMRFCRGRSSVKEESLQGGAC